MRNNWFFLCEEQLIFFFIGEEQLIWNMAFLTKILVVFATIETMSNKKGKKKKKKLYKHKIQNVKKNNSKDICIFCRHETCLFIWPNISGNFQFKHTHTHVCIYIYIYIYTLWSNHYTILSVFLHYS